MQVPSLGWEDSLLEEGMVTHSRILVWRIPWTEDPGELQPTGSQSQTRLSRSLSASVCELLHLEHSPRRIVMASLRFLVHPWAVISSRSEIQFCHFRNLRN